MEVIACIPELPRIPPGHDAGPSAHDEVTAAATPRPAPTVVPSAAGATRAPDDMEADEPPAVRRRAVGRRRTTAFPTPSVLVLAAVAAAVWAAAWRSERLRAIEQQRPQRVAMEPTASAGDGRSVTP